LDISFDELLELLEEAGERNNCVAVLLIDAINESDKTQRWDRQRKRFSNSIGTARNGCLIKQELLNTDIACGKNSYLHLFNGCRAQRIGKTACPFSIGTIPKNAAV